MPSPPEPIAIVGLGAVFPGAPNAARFWENIVEGVDAIREAPPSRIEPVFFEPGTGPDRFYCRRGGFLTDEATFDPLAFGVMPRAAEGAEPDQLLMLEVARQALEDAGLVDSGAWRQQTAVIFGRGGYLTPGLVRLDQRVRTGQQIQDILRAQLPGLSEEQLLAIKSAFQAKLGPFGPDTAIGLVPNLAASRVANRLDLCGPAYTVDAACASSLLAVDQACRELWSGRSDVALAGGVHVCQDVTFWSVFTQLGALSRAQEIRPFDRDADGLLIGEGAGVLVLQRLSDARRDGRRIYARLLSVGISSDGRGATLLSPRVEGQVLALERAWKAAGVDPASAGLIEAHGTATVQGDEAELTTLKRFFGDESGAPRMLGSVKSMIGHAMPAAGAAGLIKTALALHHGTIPPSLHCDDPHALLEGTRWQVPAFAHPWEDSGQGPRRAAVNAFGFGGINAHAVLEAETPPRRRHTVPVEIELRPQVISAPDMATLVAKLEAGENHAGPGPLRLVLFNPTPERRALARKVVAREKPWRDHDDLWFSPKGLLREGGKIAFLFPGIEPTFDPRVDDVADHFGLAPPPTAGSLEETGLAVVAVSRILARALGRLGVHPHALAGHSIGEWTGMVVSERIPTTFAQPFIDSLAPGTLKVPDVVFAMAGCSSEKATEALAGIRGVTLSHDNCPHQVILCGEEQPLGEVLERLRTMQVLTQRLPFRSGFHSPLFRDFLAPLRERLEGIPLEAGRIPLWSATTCLPYPADAAEVRTLVCDHLVQTVRFRELIERLHRDGVRAFVQVGAGNGLTGFVEDTLRGQPHVAIPTNLKKRTGLAQLRRTLAALFCEGLDVDVLQLSSHDSAAPRLNLDVPLVRLPPMLGDVPTPAQLPQVSTPLAERFTESLQHLARAQREVLAALESPARAPVPTTWSEKRKLSPESHPFLLDHCFYRQPAGWADLSDRFPIVPATLTLEWLREAGEKVAGERIDVLQNLLALRWLAVSPPAEITLRSERLAAGRAAVSIDGFSQGEAVWGTKATAWTSPPPLDAPVPVPLDAKRLYADRWMFHGPSYQGITALTSWSQSEAGRGIEGEITVPDAPGALLDNAGQIFGLWVMLTADRDRLALPVHMERVAFFSPNPAPGARLRCAVRITAFTEREVRADLWLTHHDGRPFCQITGWEDRRFDSDARLWEVLRWPERELLAERRPGGYLRVTDAWRQLPSRELLARRYLGAEERKTWEALPARRQGPWLNGRIAVKDAVRDHLWRKGQGAIFPVEIQVRNDDAGRPLVQGPFEAALHVSLAHVEGGAVALVSDVSPVGIDLERPQPRPPGFLEVVVTDEERALLPALDDTWLMRVWTAKEAAAKARGTGLGGDPRKLKLQACAGEKMLIDGIWVQSVWDDPFIVSFCLLSLGSQST